jgi:hypothetical protein
VSDCSNFDMTVHTGTREYIVLRPTVFARFCATLVARWPNLGAGTNRRVGGVNGVFDCRHLGGVLAK